MARAEKHELTGKFVSGLRPKEKAYRIWDAETDGLYLHVLPTGKKFWRYYYRVDGKQRTITIGSTGRFSVSQARNKAKIYAGQMVKDKDPLQTRKEKLRIEKIAVLQDYLDKIYSDVISGQKRSGETLDRIKRAFKDLLDKRIDQISELDLKRWKAKRLKAGTAETTIQRDWNALRGLFSHALNTGLIDSHPMPKNAKTGKHEQLVRPPDHKRVRFLSAEEESRLRRALADRDNQHQTDRLSANAWREERRYELLPEIPEGGFGDYLTPIVLTGINTGLRRAELLSLTWDRINLDSRTRTLTVHATHAKSKKTRYIPLNEEALGVLTRWKRQAVGDLVFPGPHGEQMKDFRKSWDRVMRIAKITDFTPHDMRHHFASKLVQAGVSLYQVQKLLGYSSITMTERYSHLAPENGLAAVEMLVGSV